MFHWQSGRQGNGSYQKMLLARSKKLKFDLWLIHYPEGSYVPPHEDRVDPKYRHHRLNLILWKAKHGGWFLCLGAHYIFNRLIYFRPDLHMHEVRRVEKGSRWVLSLGWLTDNSKIPGRRW